MANILDHDEHDRHRKTDALREKIIKHGMTPKHFQNEPVHLVTRAIAVLFGFEPGHWTLLDYEIEVIEHAIKEYEDSVNPAGPGNDPDPS